MDIEALKNINLHISSGTLIGIKGVSGSGKSTLLHLIGCLDSPTEGEIYINGKKINGLKEKELASLRCKEIGFVLQDFGLVPYRSVYDNIMVPLCFSKMSYNEFDGRIKKAASDVGISDLLKRRVSKLSGGQKQRVAIARAIVNNPNIILADEPTGQLDSKTGFEICELLSSLKNIGKTVVVATHDEKVAGFCDTIYTIVDGELVD